ncbi:hypothetical protein LTR97_007494 [Elasticomyces elasticus]|uniref:DUF7605 domain-containing protein n=1 Tax=Elasticomyces elasticus TaxID=574655 RepID=A0AAN7ZMU4_9PEZI|nr:hypothetical protein LTR97_007494 [Elasticomyces elasticus]
MTSPAESFSYASNGIKRKRNGELFSELYDLTSESEGSLSSKPAADDTEDAYRRPSSDDADAQEVVISWPDKTGPEHCGAQGPAFDTEFDDIAAHFTTAAAKVVNNIQDHHMASHRFQATLGKAEQLSQPLEMPRRHIAIVLAKALSSGARVTNVAMSAGAPMPEQRKEYAAIVVFLHTKALRLKIVGWVSSYQAWHSQSPDEAEGLHAVEQAATSAFNAISGLVGSRFQSEEDLHSFLKGNDGGKIVSIWKALLSWFEELIVEATPSGLLEADTCEELHTLLEPYTETTSAPALWPLVQLIRVGAKGCDILHSMTFADTSGFDDTDPNRAGAYKLLIADYDEILLVVDMKRIGSEDTVPKFLRDYGRSAKRITLIGSRSDDGLQEHHENLGLYKLFHAKALEDGDTHQLGELARLKGHLDNEQRLRATQTSLARKLGASSETSSPKRQKTSSSEFDKSSVPSGDLHRSHQRLEQIEAQLTEARQATHESLVACRNNHNVRSVHEQYDEFMRAGEELLFQPVSSAHFAARQEYRKEVFPCLPTEATGILDVRKDLYDSLGRARLQTLHNHIYGEISPFADGLALLVDVNSLCGRDEAVGLLETARLAYGTLIEKYETDLDLSIQDVLVKPLQEGRELFGQHARQVFATKSETWDHRTLLAFMLKYGNNETKKQPKEVWNDQFAEPMVTAARQQCDVFETQFTLLNERFEDKTLQLFQGLSCHMKAGVIARVRSRWNYGNAESLLDQGRYASLIQGHTEGISELTEGFKVAALNRTRGATADALVAGPNNHFSRAMKPAYRRCARTKGKNRVETCIRLLETHLVRLDDSSPFIVTGQMLGEDVGSAVDADLTNLSGSVYGRFNMIGTHLDAMFNEKNAAEGEVALRADLKSLLPEVDKAIADSKYRLAELLKKYEATES